MPTRITVKDIARRAGVGTTTVSRVLNNQQYVSDELRAKVMKAVEELEYRPNFNARWLRGGRTSLIGFITDQVATTPYAVDIIRGAQEAASERGNVLMVLNSNSVEDTAEAIEFLLERQVAGIIYAAMFHREVSLPDNAFQTPMALANCYVADRSLPSAVPDEFQGGYTMTRQLLEAGHRRIAFLNVFPPAKDAAEGRFTGYKQALAGYGVALDPSLVGRISDESIDNYATTKAFLESDNPPTAFFVGNDRSTIGCYAAIRDAGLQIPDDIGIVGFDNQQDIARNMLPALTTAQLPHYEMGAWAFNQLYEEDENSDSPQVKIECQLILRDSV